MKYFANFPVITYANNTVRNVFAKVQFDKKLEEYSNSFYPYQLVEGDRADVLAYAYYNDSFNDWLIYFANKVVDPYFDYYLDQRNFNNYITQKYGSITTAQSQIYAYRNNWSDDETILTVAQYTALTTNLKKYWTPVLGYSGAVTGYKRNPLDTYLTTNRIDILTIQLSSNNSFTVNEKVTQYNGSTPVANAYVTFANTSVVTVQHQDGQFQANTSYTLKGASANAIVSTVTLIKQNYETNETTYYSTMSTYDFENEMNEQKRSINLVDNRYSATIERQFRHLLNK